MNLNTKILSGTIGAVMCFSVSCSLLDVEPYNAVERDKVYNVTSDLYAIKTGLYNTLQGLVEQNFVLGELRGDLVTPAKGARNNPDMYEFMCHDISPDNKYLDWSGYYTLINQCNDALAALPILYEKADTITELMPKVYKHVVGEVLWLRSWAYFSLVKNWGDVPFVTEPLYRAQDIKEYPVTKEDKILDQLEVDITWAVNNLNVQWAWGQGTSISKYWNHETVNMAPAVCLLAEVLMYRGKLQDAWNNNVLLKIMEHQYVDGTPGHEEDWNATYNLTGVNFDGGKEWFNVLFRWAVEDYRSSWYEQGLVIAFDTESGAGTGYYHETHPLGKFTSNRLEEGELYVLKPSVPSIRIWTELRDTYRGRGYSYYVDGVDTIIWKHVGIDPNGTRRGIDRTLGVGNIMLLRCVDTYLRGAETANRLGLSQRAIDVMNLVRNRAGVMPVAFKSNATIEEIENTIIDERAAELAYESVRWDDLVRIAKRRNDPNYLIDRVVAAAPASQREALRARLELQSFNWWKLPYGTKAVMVNPALKQE